MGIGKMLALAALGIGAVAAAPFTGGGSILGAATLAGSLAGAGAIAAATGAGAAGAGLGYVLSRNEKDEMDEKDEAIAKMAIKAQKGENIAKQHEKHTNLILALSALGFAMANADGKISPEEAEELDLFIGGLSSQAYPEHITNQLRELKSNPPTFVEALKYLELVESVEYSEIRNLLVAVMESDGFSDEKEVAFLGAFDITVNRLSK